MGSARRCWSRGRRRRDLCGSRSADARAATLYVDGYEVPVPRDRRGRTPGVRRPCTRAAGTTSQLVTQPVGPGRPSSARQPRRGPGPRVGPASGVTPPASTSGLRRPAHGPSRTSGVHGVSPAASGLRLPRAGSAIRRRATPSNQAPARSTRVARRDPTGCSPRSTEIPAARPRSHRPAPRSRARHRDQRAGNAIPRAGNAIRGPARSRSTTGNAIPVARRHDPTCRRRVSTGRRPRSRRQASTPSRDRAGASRTSGEAFRCTAARDSPDDSSS